MGCGQSKIEQEEAVARCKARKEFMKKAVSSRNAFAAAHSGYTISLKNTGAALSDYAQGEAIHHHHTIPPSSSPASATASHHPSSSSSASASASASASIPSSSAAAAAAATTILQPPIDTHLPPPPPLPDFAPPPLQRAASMPDLPIPKKPPASKPSGDEAIREEDDDGDDADDEDEDDDGGGSGSGAGDGRIEHRRRRNNNNSGGDVRPPAPPPPAPAPQQVPAETSGSEKLTGGGGAPVWLSDYFFDTDNIPVPSLSQPEPEEIPLPTATMVRASDPVTGAGGRGDHDDNIREIPQEKVVTDPPPPPPQQQQPAPPKPVKKKVAHHQHGASAGGEMTKRGRTVAHTGPKVDLLKVMNELDDHFLKASESAHEVSKMLEATRMHYHSNFADNRGHIDHSARIMRVITWNRSCKNLKDEDDGNDDFDNEELETHATILDKMLAWEKKLYDEVKAGELMKIEYQRKVASLNKQKKRGASPETLEKTKAAVSHLHTRYIVDTQSMDLTVSEINRLRDKQLYPKLVDLVYGMAKMWEAMFVHHSSQLKIVANLRNLNTSLAPWDTSEQHHKITGNLWSVLREWHSQFQNLMKNQKEYIKALNDWLKLNLIPVESNLKEKLSSPPRVIRPAIQPLLHAWHDLLEKLPDDRARGVINTFAEVVHTIYIIQEDELKLRERCEDTRREYMRKSRQFDDWYHKYSEKKAAAAAAAAAEAEEDNAAVSDSVSRETTNQDDEIVAERKAAVDSLMIRLEAEEDTYHRTCKQVREKSIGSLKTHLPELFRAMSDFALDCSEMYKRLRSITTKPHDTVEAAS